MMILRFSGPACLYIMTTPDHRLGLVIQRSMLASSHVIPMEPAMKPGEYLSTFWVPACGRQPSRGWAPGGEASFSAAWQVPQRFHGCAAPALWSRHGRQFCTKAGDTGQKKTRRAGVV